MTKRRPCQDFPPLVWFSKWSQPPRCLLASDLMVTPNAGGPAVSARSYFHWDDKTARLMINGMALHRVALGFPLGDGDIVPWEQHFGYSTREGRDLNESARAAGDDPKHWYVAEAPIDVMRASEIWTSGDIFTPRLSAQPEYLKQVKMMVELCRKMPSVEIPPTWTESRQVQQMIAQSKINGPGPLRSPRI